MIEEPEDYAGKSLADWWDWNGRYLKWLARFIPIGDEPEIYSESGDEDESSWRELSQRRAAEVELRGEVRAVLERFFDDWEWKVEADDPRVLFLAEYRLQWAAGFCGALSALPRGHGIVGLDPGEEVSAPQIWRWLTLDCYEAGFVLPKRWDEMLNRDRW